jgi:hypothetical protein
MATATVPPIYTTLQRVTDQIAYLGAHVGPAAEGWIRASEIVASPPIVSSLLDQICAANNTDDRQVAAAFLVLGYFWYPMASALACYLQERRVPDLSASAIALHPRGGVTFLSPRCWALPDDPDADHGDVMVVADRVALRERLVSPLNQEHAAPLFATLRSVAPYGLAAMRANYADRLVSAALWITEATARPAVARAEVPALLGLVRPPTRTGIIEIEADGQQGLFVRRAGCCLNYRIPGKDKCDTCCLIPLPERIDHLRQTMIASVAS